ncbi:MAG TPA: YicC family protein [Desulfobacteraceae bacterium]|nr:YicC family protein [Deltaproteobacteria bacterium]HDI59928.1 YicC family protein [Desulfobacteraceae bacterium]
MINSMTAYGRAEKAADGLSVAVEIRSVNSRFLDIVARLPHGYGGWEEPIKARIGACLERGRVELRLTIRDERRPEAGFEVDLPLASAYHQALCQLRDALTPGGEVPLALLAGANGVIRPSEVEPDLDGDWPLIEDCLASALAALQDMRRTEGANLAADFSRRLDFVEAGIDAIEADCQGLVEVYRKRLQARLEALTEGVVALDPARIAQEAALLADRSDISEEIVRARSHLSQFRALMAGPEPAGRQLNFLLQELGREMNTIGAKTDQADVAHRVVAVKAELEKLREQVQNVE